MMFVMSLLCNTGFLTFCNLKSLLEIDYSCCHSKIDGKWQWDHTISLLSGIGVGVSLQWLAPVLL